jgi:tetratricopeptide (TPR) repeat protein
VVQARKPPILGPVKAWVICTGGTVQNFPGAIRMRFIDINARDVLMRRRGDSMLYSYAAGGKCAGAQFLQASGSIVMVTRSARRRVLYAILTTTIIFAGQGPLIRTSAAQAPTGPSAATSTPPSANQTAQALTEWLIKDSVSEGTASSPQYSPVTEAVTRFTNGDVNGARDLLTQAVQKNPNKLPPVEVMMGRLQSLRQGGAQFARAELEKAVMVNANDPDAYLYFAEAALQDHRIADAEGLLLEVKPLIDKFSANAKRKRGFEIRFNSFMAAVAEAREQWDTAAQYLAALQKLEPENPTGVEAHLRLGRAMFKQGKSKTDVYFELEKASKTDSKAIDPYIYLAYLNEEEKRHPDAKDIIAQAVNKHGTDLNVMLAAAKWALNTGEFKDAQTYADAVNKIDPKSLEGKIVRGEVARFASPPDLKKAREMFESAVYQSPANLEATNQLALVLIESNDSGDQQKAVDLAKANAALTTRGNQFSPEVIATYAWTLYRAGHQQEAETVLNQLLSAQKQLSPDTIYYIGKILQERGKIDEAIQFLEAALKVPTPFAQRDATTKLLAELKKDKEKSDKDSEKSTTPPSTATSTSEKKK